MRRFWTRTNQSLNNYYHLCKDKVRNGMMGITKWSLKSSVFFVIVVVLFFLLKSSQLTRDSLGFQKEIILIKYFKNKDFKGTFSKHIPYTQIDRLAANISTTLHFAGTSSHLKLFLGKFHNFSQHHVIKYTYVLNQHPWKQYRALTKFNSRLWYLRKLWSK